MGEKVYSFLQYMLYRFIVVGIVFFATLVAICAGKYISAVFAGMCSLLCLHAVKYTAYISYANESVIRLCWLVIMQQIL